MKHRLLNSALMPLPGVYSFRSVTQVQFVELIRQAHSAGTLVSYCGYPQNAAMLTRLSGVPVGVSREHVKNDLRYGDVLLIMTLSYRLEGIKGKPVSETDFEYGVAEYVAKKDLSEIKND